MAQEQITETALVKISPLTDPSITSLRLESQRILDYATALQVTSDEDIRSVTNDLSLIANLKKALEDKRKEYVSPLNSYVKEINSAFKSISDPLDTADKVTRSKILAYRQEVDRQRKEAEELNRLKEEVARREREAVAKSGEEPPPLPQKVEVIPPVPRRVHAEAGTLATMSVRKWELANFSQVPDDYKMLDSTKITKVVKAGIPSIPGIRIWEEETLRVTARGGQEAPHYRLNVNGNELPEI